MINGKVGFLRVFEPIFFSILAYLLLSLSALPGREVIGISLLAISFAGRFRLQVLAFANFILLVFFNLIFSNLGGYQVLALDQSRKIGYGPLVEVKLTALVILFAIFWAFWQIHRRTQFKYVMLLNLAALSLLVFWLNSSSFSWWFPYYLLRTVVLYFAQFFWMLSFSMMALAHASTVSMARFLASIPFWNSFTSWHIGAVPRGVGELEDCTCTDERSLRQARIRGLKLIALSDLLQLLFTLYDAQLVRMDENSTFIVNNLSELNPLHLAFYSLCLSDFLKGIRFVLWYSRDALMMVGVVHFCGFRIPLAIQNVFQARNFSEFLRRFYFYYSETLYFFFGPLLWPVVRFFNFGQRLQGAVMVFLTLLLGGIVIHAIEFVQLWVPPYPMNGKLLLAFTPYLFLLALFAGLSTYSHRRKPLKKWHILAAIGYFLLYFLSRLPDAWFNLVFKNTFHPWAQ